jgi:hypothetical protein
MTTFKDGRDFPYILLDRKADDMGLDPYEMALYVHIIRRCGRDEKQKEQGKDTCSEAIANMAKHCKMSTGSAKRALRQLLEMRMITRHPRPGQTSEYRLTDSAIWIPRLETTRVTTDPYPGHDMATPWPPQIHHLATTDPPPGSPQIHHLGHQVATKNNPKEQPSKEQPFEECPEDEKVSSPTPQPEGKHPNDIARFEQSFNAVEDDPWVLSRRGRNRTYQPKFLDAVKKHLKTTPSYEKVDPTDFNAIQWINRAYSPNPMEAESRMADVWALWEIKAREAEVTQSASQYQVAEAPEDPEEYKRHIQALRFERGIA